MAFVAISRLSARRGLLGMKQAFLMPQGAPALLAPCHTMVKSGTGHDERCVLSAYATGLGLAALVMPHDMTHYLNALETMHIGAPVLIMAKFCLAFPLMYHTCNGVRHLMWDTASNLNKQAVVTTGSVMLAAAAATTALIMFL